MLRNTGRVTGYDLRSRDGKIGRVKDFYFDDVRWAVRYLVADTGTWLAPRQVLISPRSVHCFRDEDQTLELNLTRDQIEKSPPIDQDQPVSRQYEEVYHHYYNYPFYWYGAGMWGASATPGMTYAAAGVSPAREDTRHRTKGDAHLRSVKAVTGYRIEALDGEIGHVEDFVFSDDYWATEYVVVDTVNWWPGKKVLVPPWWTSDVSWHDARLSLNLDKATIKGAPEYDMSKGISREYETALFSYYSNTPYWAEGKAA